MLQVRNILCDIIDVAYKDNPNIQRYKKFYIEMVNKNRKGKHGDYLLDKHYIHIFNLYRDDAAIIATTIHELAHHVDNINRGTTNHDKEFYEVFKVLLHTALDMNIFQIDDFLNANKDAADSNKIAKMILYYQPKNIGYKENLSKIIVKNCFDIKDKLKENQYKYNSINKTWEKEIDKSNIEQEKKWLNQLNASFDIESASTFGFDKKRYMYISKGAFEIKEELKENGFFFDSKKKVWKKEFNEKDFYLYRKKWNGIAIFVD